MLLDAVTAAGFCTKAQSVLVFVGWALTIFKIAIPLIIVIYGMIDFGKAVVSEKDDDIKKSAKSLGRRAIAGVIIFFIPAIVIWLFGTITADGWGGTGDKSDFAVCSKCLLNPGDC